MADQRRRWRWWLGGAAALVFLYFAQMGFFAWAFYAAVGTVLLAYGMSHWALVGLKTKRYCSTTRARIGERFIVSLELHNDKWLPVPWLLLDDLYPEDLPFEGTPTKVVSLRPYQTVSLRYEMKATRRGYYQLGPLVVESGDLFGLVRNFKMFEEAHYVLVHPKVVPIARYGLLSPRPIGEVRGGRPWFEDPSRLAGVREYRPGDRLQRIHWRTTARLGRLMSKVYEPSTLLGAQVILDFYAPAYQRKQVVERSELGVVAAASIAYYLWTRHERMGFLSNGRDAADRIRWERRVREARTREEAKRLAAMKERSERLRPVEVPPAKDWEQLERILDTLARLELSDGLPLAEMLWNEYPRLSRDVATVLIVPQVSAALLEVIAQMQRSGFSLSVLVIGNMADALRARYVLARSKIPVFPIEREEDLYVLETQPLVHLY